ncbi:MAG: TolC family protein, partial [Deltaproteobacteria bacterium]|nr:TolC family protein [Deltaproteobacteria bacterium]
MRQELKEKKLFNGNRPTISKKEWVVVRYSLLYLFLFLWLWPLSILAQPSSFIESPFLLSADGSEGQADESYLENSHAVRLSLRDALYYSLQGNQDIQISAFTPKQAKEDLIAAQSVYDPSFFLSASHDRILDSESDLLDPTIDEETSFKVGIKKLLATGGTVSLFLKTQRFDKIDVPFDFESRYLTAPAFELKQPLLKNIGAKEQKATITIQNNNVNISEAEFQQTVNDTLAQVSRIYWRLYMHREIVDINRKTLEMAQEVHRREVVRMDEGISKSLDVARAQSAAEARRTEVLRSQERVRVVTDQLKFLLNWSNLNIDSNNLIIPVESPQTNPITVDGAAAIKNGLGNRPEIEKARKNQDIAKVHEDLARHQRLPKLDAFMNYGVNGYDGRLSDAFGDIAFDDENDWTVGLEFELPIGNRLAKATHRKQML